VLLTNPGVDSDLKVIDFGLATFVRPDQLLTRHVGTPYYVAPEVLGKSYGKSCDLWSVGIITFTLLCGACVPLPEGYLCCRCCCVVRCVPLCQCRHRRHRSSA